ncbi:MAG: aminotransferase class V-fold PLP-dependent enzyme [Pirellulaceae bacterium]|nr:aminotransferase class V-fold PLP-dependent enzyme [Pirellulaceae bacterium]
MGVFQNLGVEPIINASGTVTRLGGAPMHASTLAAMREAAENWVPIEQLQGAASNLISEVTGAEAGMVTSGAAAGLTLGAAAIMTGDDLGLMERLPQTDGSANEFIMAREQRSGYDHAVRASGAKIVEVGFNEIVSGAGVRRTEIWEYEAAIGERTAGIFYVFTNDSVPPLEEVVACAKRHQLPVLVDAAGELPPRSNLRWVVSTGADLVTFSGGKAIRGPQSTGILCGRQKLVGAAALQMLDMDDHPELWQPPEELIQRPAASGLPRHGIGRGMKVSKEEIVGLLTALEMFVKGEYVSDLEHYRSYLQTIQEALAPTSTNATIIESSDGERWPILEVQLKDPQHDAFAICQNLRQGKPPIYLGHGKLSCGILVVNPVCLNTESANILGQRLLEEMS